MVLGGCGDSTDSHHQANGAKEKKGGGGVETKGGRGAEGWLTVLRACGW